MTTTLRPAGAEERGADGARSRRFTVCVNSRPVGAVHLATDERFGPAVGRIVSLAVDEKDRGRGRGAVAALAAEEVLRGWGCDRVEASVPADAEIAVRLAGALGYVERSRGMAKSLPDTPPALPEDVVVRPMDDAGYRAWQERDRARHIDGWVQRGVPYEQAAARVDHDHRLLLGDGPRTADTALRILAHGGEDVGWLWVALRARRDDLRATAWVYAVEVAGSRRGQGHGRTLMLLAERECLAEGVRHLGLNVFAGNTPALRLYESLGYRCTELHMAKPLL